MRYPGATWEPISHDYTPGTIRARTLGLILHVEVGNGDDHNWFDNVATRASTHFWVGKDGRVAQYVDTADMAWAQVGGNPDYLSTETEGLPTEPLTAAQVASLGKLYAWGHQQFGWVNAQANAPGQLGLGWHGMGGVAWGNHPGCPGDLRKAQRAAILAAAFPVPAPQPVPTPVVTTKGASMVAFIQEPAGNGIYSLMADGKLLHVDPATWANYQANPVHVPFFKAGPEWWGHVVAEYGQPIG